ncbi:hypothetical protein [Halovivax cerinus]|uniref:Uncharacterized protein n=1 Tax=Halovivax cerinus TaxID=1487865 RepID=A0ABD5NKD9_9EURY|nr:hypothetical protein [Halovivax cerinus]
MGKNSSEVNRRSVLRSLSGAGIAVAGTGTGLAATGSAEVNSDVGILPYTDCTPNFGEEFGDDDNGIGHCDDLLPQATTPVWSVMDYTFEEERKCSQQVLSYFGARYLPGEDEWAHRFTLQGHQVAASLSSDYGYAPDYTCPMDNTSSLYTKNHASIDIESDTGSLLIEHDTDSMGFYDFATFVNHYEQEHGELEDPRTVDGCSRIDVEEEGNDYFYDTPSPFSDEESMAFRSLFDPDAPDEPITDRAIDLTDEIQANTPLLEDPVNDDFAVDLMLAMIGTAGTGIGVAAPQFGAAVSIGVTMVDLFAGIDWKDNDDERGVERPGGENAWDAGYEPSTIGTPAGHFVHFEVHLDPDTHTEPIDVAVQSTLLDEEHSMTVTLQPLGQPDRAPDPALGRYSFVGNDAAVPPSDGVYDIFERPEGGTDPIIEEVHCPSLVAPDESFECSAVVNSASTRDIAYYAWANDHSVEDDSQQDTLQWCNTTDSGVPNWEHCGFQDPGEAEITLVVGDEAGLFDYETVTMVVGEPEEGEMLPTGGPGDQVLGTSEASGLTVPNGTNQWVGA